VSEEAEQGSGDGMHSDNFIVRRVQDWVRLFYDMSVLRFNCFLLLRSLLMIGLGSNNGTTVCHRPRQPSQHHFSVT